MKPGGTQLRFTLDCERRVAVERPERDAVESATLGGQCRAKRFLRRACFGTLTDGAVTARVVVRHAFEHAAKRHECAAHFLKRQSRAGLRRV